MGWMGHRPSHHPAPSPAPTIPPKVCASGARLFWGGGTVRRRAPTDTLCLEDAVRGQDGSAKRGKCSHWVSVQMAVQAPGDSDRRPAWHSAASPDCPHSALWLVSLAYRKEHEAIQAVDSQQASQVAQPDGEHEPCPMFATRLSKSVRRLPSLVLLCGDGMDRHSIEVSCRLAVEAGTENFLPSVFLAHPRLFLALLAAAGRWHGPGQRRGSDETSGSGASHRLVVFLGQQNRDRAGMEMDQSSVYFGHGSKQQRRRCAELSLIAYLITSPSIHRLHLALLFVRTDRGACVAPS